ncbi:NAD(P)-binding protein [Aspergillus welwitschiae]|uniref:NAD(P)-binding protein n=1 Tax=Aspergillus welwitschiae TaxID=1341132 RepID=A0A3F3QEP8_9EURO|nr:NAD(P)-binding protein [Aspergillus welwitschiae]RDH37754.1 NAD(P)-binding protein [Aspergillus welwitschiae]
MPLNYLLTGSTGGLGSLILDYFTTHFPPTQESSTTNSITYAAASSNPSNSHRFTSKGIPFRTVNYDDPETLDVAFKDVENLFFVSTDTFDVEKRRRQHLNVVEAAKRNGVKHVWYTSLAFGGLGSNSKAAVQQAHYMTEDMLRESGINYTSIREGIYTEAFPLFLNWYPQSTTLYLPSASGKIAFTLRSELAEATAKLILKGGHDKEVVLFTASEPVSMQEIVEVINETTHREVKIKIVDPETYVRVNAENDIGGKAEGFFRQLVGWFESIENGEAGFTDGLMGEVLGREPVTPREAIRGLLEKEKDYTWHQNYSK